MKASAHLFHDLINVKGNLEITDWFSPILISINIGFQILFGKVAE